jgi:hypothetical protein
MNAKRMYKEARPLFWPWCAVVLAGALPLSRPLHSIAWISLFGFLVGIPLLASLPFGDEFQHRTFSLLLSQPISRMEMWHEKLNATVVAVTSAALILSLSGCGLVYPKNVRVWPLFIAIIIAMTASAAFWTLLARSTLGGAALNVAGLFFIYSIAFIWAEKYRTAENFMLAVPRIVLTAAFFFLGYAGVMLWLGGRMLARFQTKGGVAGYDLLTAGPQVLPGTSVSWLRYRPRGAVLNLIRKEFRLLRPVWLISLLAALGWAWLTLLAVTGPPQRLSPIQFGTGVFVLDVTAMLLIAILAGSLSLGEERTSGTHSWHLTLPVSARRLWFIKLGMALFAGFVCAALVPLLIARRLMAPLSDVHVGRDLLVGAALLTFAAFWCASGVKGTVPAVLWALPVMVALYFAVELGKWAGPALTNLFLSRFDPFANVKFAAAVSHLRSNAFFKLIEAASTNMTDSVQAAFVLTIIMLVPALLYAVIQSYRMFRAQIQDRVLSVVRSLLPLAVLAFLCSFSSLAFYTFVGQAAWAALDPRWIALTETIGALQKIQSGGAKPAAAHPLELAVEDLAKASTLSKSTRRLLGDSHITLSLDAPPHHGRSGCAENPLPFGRFARGDSWYSAIIHLDGSSFAVAFDPGTGNAVSVGLCAGQPPPFPEGGAVRVPR